MDYKTLTDEQLQQLSDQDFTQLREDIMSEQVRRNRLKEIPNEVASLKAQFEAVGGTTDELIAKLNETTPSGESEVVELEQGESPVESELKPEAQE